MTCNNEWTTYREVQPLIATQNVNVYLRYGIWKDPNTRKLLARKSTHCKVSCRLARIFHWRANWGSCTFSRCSNQSQHKARLWLATSWNAATVHVRALSYLLSSIPYWRGEVRNISKQTLTNIGFVFRHGLLVMLERIPNRVELKYDELHFTQKFICEWNDLH